MEPTKKKERDREDRRDTDRNRRRLLSAPLLTNFSNTVIRGGGGGERGGGGGDRRRGRASRFFFLHLTVQCQNRPGALREGVVKSLRLQTPDTRRHPGHFSSIFGRRVKEYGGTGLV